MCGIAGFTGGSDTGVLEALLDDMHHRGPDGRGRFSCDWIQMGMTRLAIVDLEGGNQPFFSQDGTKCLVFNGEIYNHRELRADLIRKGRHFRSDHSDTEVIIHLFDEYGIDFISKLNGMYAIAIVDLRRQSLYLIRDRIGERTIYYSLLPDGQIAFASEYPVLANYLKGFEADPGAWKWLLAMKAPPVSQSADRRIQRIPPGTYLHWQAHKAPHLERYYRPGANRVDIASTREERADQFEALLKDSISLRMTADVEVGAYLSGGIDSSLAVWFAAQTTSKPLRTYALVYEEEVYGKSTDRKFSRLIAEQIGSQHQEVVLTPEIFQDQIPSIVRQYGQPTAATFSSWFVSRAMHRDLKVAISGDGPDELFGSYFMHRVSAAMDAQASGGKQVLESLPPGERQFIEKYQSSSLARMVESFAVFSHEDQKHLVGPLLQGGASISSQLDDAFASIQEPSFLEQMLQFEFDHSFIEQVLHYADVLTMAHSMETRIPFLDHRIVDFVFSLPTEDRCVVGETKRLLKMVARRHLPTDLVDRPKEGFIEPNIHWLHGPLFPFFQQVMAEASARNYGLIRWEKIAPLVKEFQATANFTVGKKLWLLFVIALWERRLDE